MLKGTHTLSNNVSALKKTRFMARKSPAPYACEAKVASPEESPTMTLCPVTLAKALAMLTAAKSEDEQKWPTKIIDITEKERISSMPTEMGQARAA
jgi:hypothetical protein